MVIHIFFFRMSSDTLEEMARALVEEIVEKVISACPVCGKEYKTLKCLETHLNEHRRLSESEEVFLCSQCPRKFKNKKYLKEHMKLHDRQPEIECETCGRKFVLYRHLKTHKHMEHTQMVCKICGEGGTPRWFEDCHRHTHKKRPRDNKECVCDLCGQKFATNRGLWGHQKAHMKLSGSKLRTDLVTLGGTEE